MEEEMGRFLASLYPYAVTVILPLLLGVVDPHAGESSTNMRDGAGIFKTSFRPVNLPDVCTFIVFLKFKNVAMVSFFHNFN